MRVLSESERLQLRGAVHDGFGRLPSLRVFADMGLVLKKGVTYQKLEQLRRLFDEVRELEAEVNSFTLPPEQPLTESTLRPLQVLATRTRTLLENIVAETDEPRVNRLLTPGFLSLMKTTQMRLHALRQIEALDFLEKFHSEPFDLNELVRRDLAAGQYFDHHGHEVTVEPPVLAYDARVHGDKELLARVIANLREDASIHPFSERGIRLRITTRRLRDGTVRLLLVSRGEAIDSRQLVASDRAGRVLNPAG